MIPEAFELSWIETLLQGASRSRVMLYCLPPLAAL